MQARHEAAKSWGPDGRDAVDAVSNAAAARDGQAEVNVVSDLGFLLIRDLAGGSSLRMPGADAGRPCR
jgi:hypothetical protein